MTQEEKENEMKEQNNKRGKMKRTEQIKEEKNKMLLKEDGWGERGKKEQEGGSD